MYRLIFQSGPQRGRRVAIRQGPVILGRHPDSALRLPEPEVALQHALLEDQPNGGVHLRRLTDEAAVLVNRQAVAAADLRDGDLIAIGPHVLQFQSGQVPVEKTVGRRVGLLQRATLLAVGLLLAGQFVFLFLVSIKPPSPATVMAPAAATETTQVVAVASATNLVAPPPEPRPLPVVTAPTVTPVRVAVAAPPPAVSAYSNEMNQMRTEIARLHRDMEALPPLPPQVITNLVVPAVVPVPPPAAPAVVVAPATNMPLADFSADDLVLAQARKMFAKAMDRAAQLDPEELDGELATIQNMAPDYLPPIIERAHLMAQRNLRPEALAQWQLVKKLAQNEDLRARAVAEIAKLQAQLVAPPPMTPVAPPPATNNPQPEVSGQKPEVRTIKSTPAAPAAIRHAPSVMPPAPSVSVSAAPRRKPVRAAQPVARLLTCESQKLLAGDKYDEMRLLRISAAAIGTAPLDLATTEVVVTFFDRGENSGRVAPSRAVVPGAPLHAALPTTADTPLEFSASYLVPRGFRQKASQVAGENTRFFGFRVELYCHGELQDRRDQPANLLPGE